MSFEPKHISQKELETIERYLQGHMSNVEHAEFEERLATDKNIRQAVTDYGMLMEGVETAGLKSRLDAYHADIEGAASADTHIESIKSHPIVKYLIAASVLLVAGLATWFIAFQQNPQEEFFTAYFEPDPGLITPMSSTDQYQFYSGMIDYKRENYDEAISKWRPLIQEKPKNDTLNYFSGVARLAQGNEDEALLYLQTAVEVEGSAFLDEAYYYLGLAYLKSDDRATAMEAFRQSNDERAAKLLAELKNEK